MKYFPLSVSSSKKIGDRTGQTKNSPTSAGINPRPPDLIVRCSTDGSKSWMIMVAIAALITGLFFHYQITGTVMRAAKRVQINVALEPVDTLG